MRSRHRECESVLVGMLLLYCMVFILIVGCGQGPLGGCPPGFAAGPERGGAPLASLTPGGLAPDQGVDQNLFCLLFPLFCRSWCPPDPLDPLYAWGGADFAPAPGQVPLLAQWHNDCLSAWRTAERSPAGLLAAMEASAARLGLPAVLDDARRQRCLALFQLLLEGDFDRDMLPTPQLVVEAWRNRPDKGPFAVDDGLGRLLERLQDGISAAEVADWRGYARSKAKAAPREYWAASCMAASVEWWQAFGEETGAVGSWGVFADLAAIRQTQDPYVIGIASLAGALYDVITHFWPDEE
jgi:hypothetical protein